jgi:pyruvate dehydrogenase complex dehydrogenase (E1) component
MSYKEDKKGQILQEGINEPGAFSSWIAAATSYANHGVSMVPFYIYYSMFGFQRVGDLAWAAGDLRSRGFLIGGTAGRTTLNGEGLQHEDGHSHIQASLIPNCVAYDPAYGYEVAVIVHDGLRRMVTEHEDVFFYVTVMNENYAQPALPEGAEEGILRGMHVVREADGDAAIQLSARARSCARCSRAPTCCATSGAPTPTCGRSPRSRAAPRRHGLRAAQPPASRPTTPSSRTSRGCSASGRPARSSPRPTTSASCPT